jgi:AcrR family transcriptional regulator
MPTTSPDTRSQILEAALACFTELGYEQTTIALIRERSGVSNGALFHRFATKEAIADSLHIEAMASFQEGLWAVVRRRPRTLRAGVRATISHQLGWIEEHEEQARFLYARGHLDWGSPAGDELAQLNSRLAQAYRGWLDSLAESGSIRPLSTLMMTAIVTGPTHAIARRWLAGHLSSPLGDYRDELVEAACAALSGVPARARSRRNQPADSGRVRLQLLDAEGGVIAEGEATAKLRRRAA